MVDDPDFDALVQELVGGSRPPQDLQQRLIATTFALILLNLARGALTRQWTIFQVTVMPTVRESPCIP